MLIELLWRYCADMDATIEFDLDSLSLPSRYIYTETANITRTFVFHDFFMTTISRMIYRLSKRN